MEENPSSSTPIQELDTVISPSFPHELLVEILSRLPVKSLVKFKCVSRTWLSLISSSQFIKTHLEISSNKDDFHHRGMIFNYPYAPPISPPHLKQCSLQSALDAPSVNEVIGIDFSVNGRYALVWVVGCFDGLVCIASVRNGLFLWNPSIRKSKKLPDMNVKYNSGRSILFGFGYDKLNDDYKVVGIFCVFSGAAVSKTLVEVYSLKTDSWKRIEDFKGGFPFDFGKYVNGKLHWATRNDFKSRKHSWKIVSLDLGNETYGEVERLDYGEGVDHWSFDVLGGCLSVLCNYKRIRADVWVMKEYGVRDSWTKVISIPYLDSPAEYRYNRPICLLRNGEILLNYGSRLVLYNPRNNTFKFSQINNFQKVNMYVESLVSPNACGGGQRQHHY
ncbi:hypothetical protein ACH5RR_031754 [Cinchona calisaya]|uniref:F-box domain-containing protein n=1 Tax=Cinchona calisaya TaxID=153742 RepID=A0ABD2YKK4_9GENT